MSPYLSHTIVALLLAVPAMADTLAAHPEAHAPTEARVSQADHAAHALPEGHADAALPATRWASDAPLREGMRRVRAAADKLSPEADERPAAVEVQAIAAELEAAVKSMIANCKLEPEPDAALHSLLARVLQVSAALSDGVMDAGAPAELHAVLARYALMFEDAGWESGEVS